MVYEIWEGQYLCNGMDKPTGPTFKGKVEANSFIEACKKIYKDDLYFNEEKLTTWGIKIYDNEKDAHDLER